LGGRYEGDGSDLPCDISLPSMGPTGPVPTLVPVLEVNDDNGAVEPLTVGYKGAAVVC